ncbi:MAG: alpha/beta hydrolase [Cellvibrionaceae bacterium]
MSLKLVEGPFLGSEIKGEIEGAVGAIELVTTEPLDGALAGESLVAVVCHPHPQHGGTMNNKVVTSLVRTYRDLGIPCVRFNFRGVGASEGSFDNAVGEVNDLMAVVEWVKLCYPQAGLLLAGFSFGSSVAAQASHRLGGELEHLVLVAPPVERYQYDLGGVFPAPVTVIIGDQDELVDVAGLLEWFDRLRVEKALLRYPEATHFFHGALGQVKRDLALELQSALG